MFAARQYAAQAGRTVWEFAVELRVLTALGLTSNDLRWLLHQGYVQHAREITKPGSARREFEHIANFMLPEGACFVLTDQGFDLLGQTYGRGWASGAATPAAGDIKLLPSWDGMARELYVGGLVVKRFKQPAASQETILAAFQEDGWPFRIDDPLPPLPHRDAKRHLHDTINNLNRHQLHPLIRFLGDGKGEGICWELRTSEPAAPTPGLHQGNSETEV
ncbi:hypothetical protein AYO44_03355 [Planctomycetaceae bacterium SCGC AG-212-F19]|nr:hypothetical protein AYO44_03355 [Planctomycetaceae bacterium SCGC AG-212-F19]